MDEQMREQLISNMTDNLPILRKKLNLTQEGFAVIVGVDRSTIAAIENHKRPMSWSLFLASLMVFTKNKETDKLLNVLDIYTDEFNEYIKNAADEKEN